MPTPAHLRLRQGVREPVVLLVSRREVEASDLDSVLTHLKAFVANREDAWGYRGQMTLVVDGYNNDPRELVDIPEVRALLRRLEAEWPYWAFFLNQVDDSIKTSSFAAPDHSGCALIGRFVVWLTSVIPRPVE